jgi:hypothetical protein
MNIPPPSFISDTKTYEEYKQDLQRWSRITSVDKKLQAEVIVYSLDGHPSQIKDKIVTKIGETLVGADDGIKKLIDFLDSVYGKDDMADIWDRYKAFSNNSRKPTEDLIDFLPNWEMLYQKLKTSGCEYTDTILGLKLLEDARLNDMDTKLVLTGVDYESAKANKNLQKQITNSLKKFTGRSIVSLGNKDNLAVAVKTEPTFFSEMEEVFIAKGWKPPMKSRRRSRSVSPSRERHSNYKGKKNRLGEDNKPLKCFICKCSHVAACNCPCVYHFADSCPDRRNRRDSGSRASEKKPELGLFMSTTILPHLADDDLVL